MSGVLVATAMLLMAQLQVYEATRPSDGALYGLPYPVANFELRGTVTATQSGTLMDTVGLNAAAPGAWTLSVEPDFRLSFRVWDGATWVQLVTDRSARPGVATTFRFRREQGALSSWLDGAPDRTMPVSIPLSGQPVYLGDFHGDEHWGAGFRIHQGFVGKLAIESFGEPAEHGGARVLESEGVRATLPPGLEVGDAAFAVKFGVETPAQVPSGIQVLTTTQVDLGDLHEFGDPLTLSVTAEGVEQPKAVRAALWDAENQSWVLLPTRYNAQENTIECQTLHLSPISWWLVTQWFHDVVETEHFKITYRRAAIQTDPERGDAAWEAAMRSNPDPVGLPIPTPKADIPLFIQDLAQTLEAVYASYKVAGFDLPTWTSTDVIVGGGDLLEEPFRDKVTGMVFCPKVLGLSYMKPGTKINRRDAIRVALAHELFHVVQGQTFSLNGMTLRKWFIEASAEYAARRIAFAGHYELDRATTSPFAAPLTTSDDELNYQAAHLFSDLQKRRGVRFKQAYDAIAGKGWALGDNLLAPVTALSGSARSALGYSLTVTQLEKLALSQQGVFGDWYLDYIASSLFELGSPITPDPDSKVTGTPTVLQAAGLQALRITSSQPVVEADLNPAPEYGARILPIISNLETKADCELTLSSIPTGLSVDLYLVEGDKRVSRKPTPIGMFRSGDRVKKQLELKPGDGLYVIALNSSRQPAKARLTLETGAMPNKQVFKRSALDSALNVGSTITVDSQTVENGLAEIRYTKRPVKGAGGAIVVPGFTRTFKATWNPLPETLQAGQSVEIVIDAEVSGEPEPPDVTSPSITLTCGPGLLSGLQGTSNTESTGHNRVQTRFNFTVPGVSRSPLRISMSFGGLIVTYDYSGA